MTSSSPNALATRIEALASGVLEEHSAVIYDLEVRPGANGLVRLLVDKSDGGITIGEVTAIAKEIGYLLDAEDVIPFTYQFEVSSPGVERPIRDARTAAMNIGAEVRLVLREEIGGKRVLEGTLQSVEGDQLAVALADGEVQTVDVNDVRRGRTVFDFESGKQRKK